MNINPDVNLLDELQLPAEVGQLRSADTDPGQLLQQSSTAPLVAVQKTSSEVYLGFKAEISKCFIA